MSRGELWYVKRRTGVCLEEKWDMSAVCQDENCCISSGELGLSLEEILGMSREELG